jgi:hypothetical protein
VHQEILHVHPHLLVRPRHCGAVADLARGGRGSRRRRRACSGEKGTETSGRGELVGG